MIMIFDTQEEIAEVVELYLYELEYSEEEIQQKHAERERLRETEGWLSDIPTTRV